MYNVSGRVRVAQSLNRERDEVYRFRIRARDHGTPPALSSTYTATVTILDVNDNSPIFTNTVYQYTISESVPVSTSIGRIVATDADTGNNANLLYTIRRYTVGDESHIVIDPDTGLFACRIKRYTTLFYDDKIWYSFYNWSTPTARAFLFKFLKS